VAKGSVKRLSMSHELLTAFGPDGRFVDPEVWLFDDERRAACWTFVATQPELRVRGCDLLEFDGAKIWSKNAFRKQPL
jgi:hypothetical protein